MPKSAIDSTKASAAPADSAGSTIGTVIFRKRRAGDRPSPSAASSSERFTCASAVATNRKTLGKNLKLNTMMTPPAPYNGGRPMPKSSSVVRTTPLAPNSTIHA